MSTVAENVGQVVSGKGCSGLDKTELAKYKKSGMCQNGDVAVTAIIANNEMVRRNSIMQQLSASSQLPTADFEGRMEEAAALPFPQLLLDLWTAVAVGMVRDDAEKSSKEGIVCAVETQVTCPRTYRTDWEPL